MSINDISTGVSAARLAMNPTPLGAATLIGGSLLGGMFGGGKDNIWQAGGTPGNYTLTSPKGTIPWQDQSVYSIKGDNGTYNLLPELGQRKTPQEIGAMLQSDPAAYQQFQSRFGLNQPPQTQDQRAMANINAPGANSAGLNINGLLGGPSQHVQPNLNIFYGQNPNAVMWDKANEFLKNQAINHTSRKFAVYANQQNNPFFTGMAQNTYTSGSNQPVYSPGNMAGTTPIPSNPGYEYDPAPTGGLSSVSNNAPAATRSSFMSNNAPPPVNLSMMANGGL